MVLQIALGGHAVVRGPQLDFSVGKLMALASGRCSARCTGRTASIFATARNFKCCMGRRTGGDDRRGDVGATGKKLTRAQVSSRSTPVSPATVANRNL
jgi:hypothetical protein